MRPEDIDAVTAVLGTEESFADVTVGIDGGGTANVLISELSTSQIGSEAPGCSSHTPNVVCRPLESTPSLATTITSPALSFPSEPVTSVGIARHLPRHPVR